MKEVTSSNTSSIRHHSGSCQSVALQTRETKNDPVNHPSHYTTGKIECIDFIEDKQLGFHLGNAIKYIVRAGKKDPSKTIEDLEKARWYLNRYIEKLSAEKGE